jgi:hypothetical protein
VTVSRLFRCQTVQQQCVDLRATIDPRGENNRFFEEGQIILDLRREDADLQDMFVAGRNYRVEVRPE